MKIAIKPEEKKEHNIPFDKIPVGYVYIADDCNGPIALKLTGGEAVLLCHEYDGDNGWFGLANIFKGVPAYEILGKLTEVVVEKE